MEGVKTFLESSTIHGLSYISITKRWTRIFWTFVVCAGFTGAILLILKSFQTWDESPIKTTIETRDISEIKLPKVTVCPPKDTLTDLNYDLMMLDNISKPGQMNKELSQFAKETVEEFVFLDGLNKLYEENRYYNWYHGYTRMLRTRLDDKDQVILELKTSATFGAITTQHYGEMFQSSLVEKYVRYYIYIYSPVSVVDDEITLHIKLERTTTGMTSGYDKGFIDGKYFYEDKTVINANISSPGKYVSIQLYRDLSSEDLATLEMDMMPGFRLSWHYTSHHTVKPDKIFTDEKLILFKR